MPSHILTSKNIRSSLQCGLVALCLFTTAALYGQASPDVPLISGGIGIFSSTNEGFTFIQPVIAPVLEFPIRKQLLIESRADIRGLFQQTNNTGPYNGTFTAVPEYLQLDYLANRHLTVVAGRFLTPFGTYNERLTAIWIRNLQDTPLSFGIGTRTSGSSNGVMLRSSLYSNAKVNIDAIGYFSASVNSGLFQAGRVAGDRVDVYLPTARLEVGTSYQRFLQDAHSNSFAAHAWWMPQHIALQIRSEFDHGAHAQGYWMEAAYPLSQFGGQDSWIARFEPIFRMQQTFRNSPGSGDGLPAADTKEADFGLDYHFPHEVRLNTSYARSFSTANGNIWDISLTYRFLIPTWRGAK